jgi:hypothetical protein
VTRGKRAADKRRLTELTVRTAKPKAAAYLIWDTRQSHLALAVQPTGTKSWKVIYSRHDGRSRWLTLGSADVIDLADARKLAGEVMLLVYHNRLIAKLKDSEHRIEHKRLDSLTTEIRSARNQLASLKRQHLSHQEQQLLRAIYDLNIISKGELHELVTKHPSE